MKFSNKKKAILAIIIANVIWGMTPPISKWSLLNIHIFTLAFLRFFIPAVMLGIVFREHLKVKKEDLSLLIALGLTDITLNIGLYFIGILHTASINVPIIASASPVFLILGSVLFLKERPSKKMLFGNLVGLTGVLLIVVEPLLHNHETSSFIGNILIVFSVISAVCGTLLTKPAIKKYSAVTITFWAFLVGSISFLPMAMFEVAQYGFLPDFSLQGLIGVTYSAVFSSLIAYYLNYYSLKYLFASETGVYTYIDPVAGIIVAIPLLSEYPTPFFIIGSILVFVGIYIAEKRINYHPFHKLFEPD